MKRTAISGVALLALAQGPAFAQQAPHPRYDYPTSARADYVIGCLGANGFSRLYLDKCSCGIDTIANMMSYDDYEKASTIKSMLSGASLGPRAGLFTDTPIAKEEMEKLHRAEAEVQIRCK